jgi:hypothetical protein
VSEQLGQQILQQVSGSQVHDLSQSQQGQLARILLRTGAGAAFLDGAEQGGDHFLHGHVAHRSEQRLERARCLLTHRCGTVAQGLLQCLYQDVCSSNSSSANGKQGALFAVECLSEKLGLLFEPYVIAIVPVLLKSFSHSSDHVREAAQGAAKVIMGKLSAHGVKQMLTPILTSLATETQWKSRQEAIRLLGTMANCAPKQLSACLPQVPAVYFSYYSGC